MEQDDYQGCKGTSCGGGKAHDRADSNGEHHPDAQVGQLAEGKGEAEEADQGPGDIRLDPGDGKRDRAVPVWGEHEQKADDGPREVVLGKGLVKAVADHRTNEALADVQQENRVEQGSFHGRQYEEGIAILSRNSE